MKGTEENIKIIVSCFIIDMAIFRKNKKAPRKKAAKRAIKKTIAKKAIVRRVAKKAIKRRVAKKAVPRRYSHKVSDHAKKIFKGLNEASQIQKGENSGISFDDFLAGF